MNYFYLVFELFLINVYLIPSIISLCCFLIHFRLSQLLLFVRFPRNFGLLFVCFLRILAESARLFVCFLRIPSPAGPFI